MKRNAVIPITALLLIILSSSLPAQYRQGLYGTGFSAGMVKLVGGERDQSLVNYISGIRLQYSFSPRITAQIAAGLGWVRPRDPDSHFTVRSGAPYKTYLYPWSAALR